jgi:hypothetical protein
LPILVICNLADAIIEGTMERKREKSEDEAAPVAEKEVAAEA